MLFVEVAQAGKEAAELEVEAVIQRRGLDEGVLYAGAAGGQQRDRRDAAEQRIDIGGDTKLRFAEIETLRVLGDRIHREAGDGDGRVALQVAIGAGEDQRKRGVECARTLCRGSSRN